MSRDIRIQPISPEAFAPFGDLLDLGDHGPDKIINQGMCGRYHDLARLDFGGGRAGISLFDAKPRDLPLKLDLVERHPLGSQAFLPISQQPFLVVVAPDLGDRPGRPLAFLTRPGQGVNFHRGTWHGVLTPLAAPGLFAVVDRIGEGDNLEEVWFDDPFMIQP